MQKTIRVLFFATFGLFVILSYRGQSLAALVSFACCLVLWVVYFMIYARGRSFGGDATQFDPVSFFVGLFFVATGIWAGVRFLPGVPTLLGSIFISAVFVLFPVCVGASIIRQQLRLRRQSN